MNETFIISLLILLMLVISWLYLLLELPFFEIGFSLIGTSLVIMSFLHERFIFLYVVIIVLGYGAFLTTYAFILNDQSNIQALYIYSHLLITAYLYLYWILLVLLKRTNYKNIELQQRVKLLGKYSPNTNVLTINEFKYQARYLFRVVERRQEEAWFVTIHLIYRNKRVQENIQETIEKTLLQTIRAEYDLVTSTEGRIYLLLMGTTIEGAEIVINRLLGNLKTELNFVEEMIVVDYTLFGDINLMDKLMEDSK